MGLTFIYFLLDQHHINIIISYNETCSFNKFFGQRCFMILVCIIHYMFSRHRNNSCATRLFPAMLGGPKCLLSLFICMLRNSTPRFVGPLVGRLVGLSPFYFFYVFAVFGLTALAQMLQKLKYCPCPPTRDWGSCVSGLVL